MRLELDQRGAVLNELPDDSGSGDWYPDDTRLALVDAAGRPLPRGAVRIDRRQASDWPARAGRAWDEGTARWAEARPGARLAARKRVLRAEIDARAGDVRNDYLTNAAPGQEGTYMLKREQALAYVAAGEPADMTDYPLIQARADAYDQTPAEAAAVILARADRWIRVGADIERERERGKRLVTEAADEAAAAAARDAAYTALDVLRPQ